MNIAIYGGSFNPIHNGHIGLAGYVVRHTDADQLWFVVTPRNPLKEEGGLADDNMRLVMARMAVENIPYILASDIEFGLPKPNYTAKTLAELSKKYPEHTFSLVIGADNMAVFDRWRNYTDILQSHKVYVYPRTGYPSTAAYPNMQVLSDAPIFPFSSTDIRARIKECRPTSGMLPEVVEEYIIKNNLYK